MIKTTRKSRALYEKHLNQYVDYENGERKIKDECYMCEADDLLVVKDQNADGCGYCPLGKLYTVIGCTQSEGYTGAYSFSSDKKEAKARMNWIIEQIHKFTDCEIVDDV